MNLPPAVNPPATVSPAAPNVNIGTQARRLIEIRHQMNNGLNISHILDIKVTDVPQNRQHALRIRREIKNRVKDVNWVINVLWNNNNIPVAIRWKMNDADDTCTIFYGVELPYIDMVVNLHTRSMLTRVGESIRASFPEYGNAWGISYSVTKPLQSFHPIPPGPIIGFPENPLEDEAREHTEAEDEEDEEEEEDHD